MFPKLTGASTPLAIHSQQPRLIFSKKTEGIHQGPFSLSLLFSPPHLLPPVSEGGTPHPTTHSSTCALVGTPNLPLTGKYGQEHLSHRFVEKVEWGHGHKAPRAVTGTCMRGFSSLLPLLLNLQRRSFPPKQGLFILRTASLLLLSTGSRLTYGPPSPCSHWLPDGFCPCSCSEPALRQVTGDASWQIRCLVLGPLCHLKPLPSSPPGNSSVASPGFSAPVICPLGLKRRPLCLPP